MVFFFFFYCLLVTACRSKDRDGLSHIIILRPNISWQHSTEPEPNPKGQSVPKQNDSKRRIKRAQKWKSHRLSSPSNAPPLSISPHPSLSPHSLSPTKPEHPPSQPRPSSKIPSTGRAPVGTRPRSPQASASPRSPSRRRIRKGKGGTPLSEDLPSRGPPFCKKRLGLQKGSRAGTRTPFSSLGWGLGC